MIRARRSKSCIPKGPIKEFYPGNEIKARVQAQVWKGDPEMSFNAGLGLAQFKLFMDRIHNVISMQFIKPLLLMTEQNKGGEDCLPSLHIQKG